MMDREKEQQRNRQRHRSFHLLASSPNSNNQWGAKDRSQEHHVWVLHVAFRNPRTCDTIFCLPGTLAGNMDLNQAHLDLGCVHSKWWLNSLCHNSYFSCPPLKTDYSFYTCYLTIWVVHVRGCLTYQCNDSVPSRTDTLLCT